MESPWPQYWVSSLMEINPHTRVASANMRVEDIDPAYSVRDVVNSSIPSKWLRKKKALEAVYRALLRYLQNHSTWNPPEIETPIDLDAIAEHGDVQQLIQVKLGRRLLLQTID